MNWMIPAIIGSVGLYYYIFQRMEFELLSPMDKVFYQARKNAGLCTKCDTNFYLIQEEIKLTVHLANLYGIATVQDED